MPLVAAEVIDDLLGDQDRPVALNGNPRVVTGNPFGTGLRARAPGAARIVARTTAAMALITAELNSSSRRERLIGGPPFPSRWTPGAPWRPGRLSAGTPRLDARDAARGSGGKARCTNPSRPASAADPGQKSQRHRDGSTQHAAAPLHSRPAHRLAPPTPRSPAGLPRSPAGDAAPNACPAARDAVDSS